MFPERLKSLRKQCGLTQKELGEHLGVSQTAVGFWEKGIKEPGVKTLLKIAKFFGVSLDYLTGQSDQLFYRHEWIGEDGEKYYAATPNKESPTPEQRRAVEESYKKPVNDVDTFEVPVSELAKLNLPAYLRRLLDEELDRRGLVRFVKGKE